MTQNDLAYYKAQNERRNMRLQRKETKRHNLEQERAQNLSAQANYLGAQASQTSAAASASQAETAKKRYQLDWENSYGMPYGKDPQDLGNYTMADNVITGDREWTTIYMSPMGYSEKYATGTEKLYKSAYEKAGTKKQDMETAYGRVRIVREGLGAFNDALNLGTKAVNIWNTYKKPSEIAGSTVPGTDLIVYGE